MFPWQHIPKTALMRSGAIQLNNYVTMTLFLNQSLQSFQLFLKMISGTSVQNVSRKKCFILPWQHILFRVLGQNWVIEILMTSCDVIFQSISAKFCILFVILRSIFVHNLSKIGQETKKLHKMAIDVIMTSFLKIAQQFFVFE